jgi:hypothetical protein
VIENTAKTTSELEGQAILFLARAGVETGAIEAMEARGQQQLLNSCDLPTKGSDDPEFLRLGFTFGEPHPQDRMFRPATLPEGWTKAGTDHAMHSKILDQHGRERVGVFYKAAFYDRRADMHLTTVYGYISGLLYYGGTPVLDDEWATVEAVTEALRGHIKREQESIDLWSRPTSVESRPEYAAQRIAEAKAEIAKAEALIAEVNR